jgi:hypothetical protein
MPENNNHNKAEHEEVPITSSEPPNLPVEQEGLFRDLLNLLEQASIPYAVAGAFALRQHTGICRDTKDLDVFLSAEDASVALVQLEKHGFDCEVRDPVWLAKAHRDGYFVDLITGMSNGLIHVDAAWIQRAYPATVAGVASRVLAPEELVASKLFVVRRERFDGADIAHIVYATRGKLQWDRVVQLAGENWEMLLWPLILFHYVYPAHSSYVPRALWKDLLERFQRAIASPDAKAKFRGSLIDENMFAIDVTEWGLDYLLEDARKRSPKITMSVEERCT